MNANSEFKPVLTKAATALQNQQKEFKVIIFEESKGLITTTEKDKFRKRVLQKSNPEENQFDIKKARHEVLNFAINNQRAQKNQKKMLIHQMLKLGAKPPKKPYKNYKDLLDERKRLKEIREQRKKFHQLGKNQTGAASVKCRSKTKLDKQTRKRLPVAAIDQHYGVVKQPPYKKKSNF